jgi:hypothetical protein
LFLNTLLLLRATFTATKFLTASYFFMRPVLSYLAVGTATWQQDDAYQHLADFAAASNENLS